MNADRPEVRTPKESEPGVVTHSAAHYLMAIHRLHKEYGYARATDVASRLRVTRGAASLAMTQLKKRALAAEDPNRFLLLTDKGHEVVHQVERNFEVLHRFLEDVLEVPADVAHADACKMEHLVSLETGRRLLWLMESVLGSPALSARIRRAMADFHDDDAYEADVDLVDDDKPGQAKPRREGRK